MAAKKKSMKLRLTLDVEVEARPFPDPLPIQEIQRDHAVFTRALDALTLSPELATILTHVVMRDDLLVEKIAESLKSPSKSAMRQAAEAGDDVQEGKVGWRAADVTVRDMPDNVINIALTRLEMTSVAVPNATAQLIP